MNESLIINFIKDNIKLLQSGGYSKDHLKQKKHEFFFQLNKLSPPKDTEIARTAISFLIRKKMVTTEESLTQLLEKPFFKQNINDSEKFFSELREKSVNEGLIIDPSKLRDVQYQEQLKDHLKDELLTERKSEFEEQEKALSEQIEKRRRELAAIPSPLIQQEVPEPATKNEVEQKEAEWWQILNLTGDPFPVADGLFKIDKSFYEQIIVRTEIVKRYVGYATNLRDQLFKNTVFYGDFGSGKTAIFHYLREVLLRNRILCVYVTLWPSIDEETNIHNFEHEIMAKLAEECKRYSVSIPDGEDKNHHQQIIALLGHLVEQRGFTGFIVFVDDLHKNQKAFEAVISFLSYLQVFTSSIVSTKNIDLAVYVSGLPHWGERLSKEKSLSGSLLRRENIPLISEFEAFEVLNKRMVAFSRNPDKNNIIGRKFVKDVYSSLSASLSTVTFRDFIKRAIEEFTNGHFDNVLTVNPNAIPAGIKKQIRGMIDSDSILSYRFQQLFHLLSDVQNEENRQECFELLGNMYNEEGKGVYDDSQSAKRHHWAYRKLLEAGLIRPIVRENRTFLIINKELLEVNEKVLRDFSLSIEDYLVPIFIDQPLTRKRVVRAPELEALAELSNPPYNLNAIQIQKTIQQHKRLIEMETGGMTAVTPSELLEICTVSLSTLTRSFLLTYRNNYPESSDGLEILNFWRSHWYKPTSIIEFLDQLENKEQIDIYRANFAFALYKDVFNDMVVFIKDQITKNKFFYYYDGLNALDYVSLEHVRDAWLKKDLKGARSHLTGYLQWKLQRTVANIFTLIYGSQSRFHERLAGSMDFKQISPQYNIALNSTTMVSGSKLAILRDTMTKSVKGHTNWEEAFAYVFFPMKEDQVFEILDKLTQEASLIQRKENHSTSYSEWASLKQLSISCMQLLQKVNSIYSQILKYCVYPNGQLIYISLCKLFDQEKISKIEVTPQDKERLLKIMSPIKEIQVNLSDEESIEARYKLDYRKFISMVSVFSRNNKEKLFNIVSENSPEFTIDVVSVKTTK